MDNQFVKVAVKPVAKNQIDILAAVKGADKYAFVGELVNAAWQAAKDAGLVTDAMLTNATATTLPRPDDEAQVVAVLEVKA